ncbi:Uma2 family endonuclease [Chamaesiphon sp. GL140_3_metabinner_50]|uniref:Uma2 family endonuclease n=1 Tax=Chamaesiphon sp. GL140_3_metabinner_50 TaxID=2970812 RepID=UPI0025CED90D|nr:Uma2 family endonuclease [Chamaesiphon sp. GL140_3_metabinner_50]
MYQYELPRYLPTADELPCSDDTPVDNELQQLIPSLLKSILRMLWDERMDWFFGIDMGIYYDDPDRPPIVPDGFLALNVERFYDEDLRSSYVLLEEEVAPILVLEVVSNPIGTEYTTKLARYAQMGVLYYVIYSLEKVLHLGKPQDRTFRNPKRRRKAKLEIHKLINGSYEPQAANPLWMPEIGLGIGSERAGYDGLTREWLYWYDERSQRYLTPYERAKLDRDRATIESQRADTESQRADRLAAQLRALGIEPEVP